MPNGLWGENRTFTFESTGPACTKPGCGLCARPCARTDSRPVSDTICRATSAPREWPSTPTEAAPEYCLMPLSAAPIYGQAVEVAPTNGGAFEGQVIGLMSLAS